MIFDTTFIIDLMKNNKDAINKAKELEGFNTYLTKPTIFELFSGVAQSNKPDEEKKKILRIIATQSILSLDYKSAKEAGEIEGNLRKNGEPIDPEDCMIAGIALSSGINKILTRNQKHFSRIKNLKIETY